MNLFKIILCVTLNTLLTTIETSIVDPALIDAVRSRDISEVLDILEYSKIQVNMIDEYGMTALMHAARFGDYKIVLALSVQDKIDVNLKNSDGHTALMLAASFGNYSTVKALLGCSDINIDLVDGEKLTALMHANAHDHDDIIDLLTQFKENGMQLEPTGNQLAHYSVDNIPKDSSVPDSDLIIAVRRHDTLAVLNILAESDRQLIIPDQYGMTPLMHAACFGDSEIFRFLLYSESDSDYINTGDKRGMTALIYAARYGNIMIVKELIQHPFIEVNAVDSNNMNALMHARKYKNGDIVKLFTINNLRKEIS